MRAIDILKHMAVKKLREKYPSMPLHAIPKPKYSDKTSNELTKCIIDYINLSGGMAERRSNTGRYVEGNSYKNVFGKEVQLTKGKYIKSSGRVGTSDISGVFKGEPLSVEVKIGKDKLSHEQKQYKADFEAAGGKYYIARNFEDWYNEFKTDFES